MPLSRRQCILEGGALAGLALLGVPPATPAEDPPRRSGGRILNVGPQRALTSLREAASVARDGDEVLIDPGEYRGDVAVWTQRDLLIRPVAGKVVLAAAGASAEDKGTFVFRNSDARVENITFTGARSRDRNGAGVRQDVGTRLALHGCRFEDNENGILTANDPACELELVHCEFVHNGAGDGQSHNVYVGAIGRLTVMGCYSARSRIGHLLKSRARDNFILYSRLSGEEGASSYELEFPVGGRAVVLGCVIQQGPKSENSGIVSYGAEGYRWERNELSISFSTIVNDRARGGSFVRVAAGRPVRVEVVDNLLVGSGDMDIRVGSATMRNVEARPDGFADAARLDYRLRRSSPHLGAAGAAGVLDKERMRPEREYVHPANTAVLERFAAMTPLSPGAFQRIAP